MDKKRAVEIACLVSRLPHRKIIFLLQYYSTNQAVNSISNFLCSRWKKSAWPQTFNPFFFVFLFFSIRPKKTCNNRINWTLWSTWSKAGKKLNKKNIKKREKKKTTFSFFCLSTLQDKWKGPEETWKTGRASVHPHDNGVNFSSQAHNNGYCPWGCGRRLSVVVIYRGSAGRDCLLRMSSPWAAKSGWQKPWRRERLEHAATGP